VAEMVAPSVESSRPEKSKATFSASNIFGQYMTGEEADQTNCDSRIKVCNIYLFKDAFLFYTGIGLLA